MKLKETDFNGFIKQGSAIPPVLIYGPDAGKNDEFASRIIEALKIPADNLVESDGAALREKFDSIYTDACSVSMFGGDKLVIVRNPDGRDSALIQDLANGAMCPVIISTGELDTKSGLRKFFEEHDKFAALPLYADNDQQIGALIRGEFTKHGISTIENDALYYMVQNLGKDRSVAKSFIEKIAIYVNDTKIVRLEDAQNCLPDSGAAKLDDFKHNLTAGNIGATLRAMDRLFAENIAPAMLIRILIMHFKDLTNCVTGGIMPRVFGKYIDLFNVSRRIWKEDDLISVLTRLVQLESDTRGSLNPELALRDFALKLSARSYKMANARRA